MSAAADAVVTPLRRLMRYKRARAFKFHRKYLFLYQSCISCFRANGFFAVNVFLFKENTADQPKIERIVIGLVVSSLVPLKMYQVRIRPFFFRMSKQIQMSLVGVCYCFISALIHILHKWHWCILLGTPGMEPPWYFSRDYVRVHS